MAFTKAAVMMDDAKSKSDDKAAFTQALRFNHLLWTIIQADITEPQNTLPPELKANIMSLSIFVDKQTTSALRSGDVSKLDALININRNLAAGLRSDPGTG
ncbi:MAG: flagellar biosynthesis regulator FlaF [Rhodospirillaceae bacterium]